MKEGETRKGGRNVVEGASFEDEPQRNRGMRQWASSLDDV